MTYEWKNYVVTIQLPLRTPEHVALYLTLVRGQAAWERMTREYLARSLYGDETSLQMGVGREEGGSVRTRIVAYDYEWRPDGHDLLLGLDDDEAGHTHDEFGHAFPCTTEQLKELRTQIDEVLNANSL